MLTILEYLHSSDPFRHLATHPMPWFLTDQICAIRQLILANIFLQRKCKSYLVCKCAASSTFSDTHRHTELTDTQN